MNQQSEHAFGSGEIHEVESIADHPRGCLCTGCRTERELARGGRYDRDIATYLHHIKDLRELRLPRSTGAGEKASGAAALASSAVRESAPNR